MRLTKVNRGGIRKCDMCNKEETLSHPDNWDLCKSCRKHGKPMPQLPLHKICEVCGDEFTIRTHYYAHQRFCSITCQGKVTRTGISPANKRYTDKKERYLDYISNPKNRLSKNIKSRINSVLKSYTNGKQQKSGKLEPIIGCTLPELVKHIEDQFEPWMTWNNYGLYTWHIDHIKPISLFDLNNREELLKANHYTNLQPLSAHDNFVKHNKYKEIETCLD